MSEIREILLDAHVHFHGAFSRPRFFDGALANLRAAASGLGLAGEPVGGLMFAESRGVNAFAELSDEARAAGDGHSSHEAGPQHGATPDGAWSFTATAEDNSLWAVRGAGPERILLIAGRQLVSREGLEVLALGCNIELADGQSLPDAIDAALAAGAVAVIPWGFGKWWGRRGAVLAELLHSPGERRFFVGDNGGRAALIPRPKLFHVAARNDIFVLPGSDPLPFAGQTTKAGRCGFRLQTSLDERCPAQSVLAALRNCSSQPQVFGRYESLPGFVGQQLAMQLYKRRAAAPRGSA